MRDARAGQQALPQGLTAVIRVPGGRIGIGYPTLGLQPLPKLVKCPVATGPLAWRGPSSHPPSTGPTTTFGRWSTGAPAPRVSDLPRRPAIGGAGTARSPTGRVDVAVPASQRSVACLRMNLPPTATFVRFCDSCHCPISSSTSAPLAARRTSPTSRPSRRRRRIAADRCIAPGIDSLIAASGTIRNEPECGRTPSPSFADCRLHVDPPRAGAGWRP
jgi:hypothetical protein